MIAPAVQVTGLRFQYSIGPAVLDIAEFTVAAGERIFIYGPSGCGKTTFLGLLAGVLTASAGKIEVLGRDLTQMKQVSRDRFRGSHMGYIFQQFNLIPYLSGLENITLPCKLSLERRERLGGIGLEESASSLAKILSVDKEIHKSPGELSVGQQQRVAATRALLGKPEIIIADEPTSALDFDQRERFLNLLLSESEKSGSAVLFVSHDRSLAKLFHRAISIPELNKSRVANHV
jgi:putative ABC transport system ATP-binding protein